MSPPVDLGEFRAAARDWLAANMEPAGEEAGLRGFGTDRPEVARRSRELQARLQRGGWAGITLPTEYGGHGLSAAHEAVFEEESAPYAMPDSHVTLGIIAPTLVAFGSEALCRAHIPRMLSGEEVWVQLLSEPGGGSDLAGVLTRAQRHGEDWVLSGQKVWSTGALHADYGLCLARSDWEVPKHRGLTFFAVRLDSPGVTVRPIREINGSATFCEEFLEDRATRQLLARAHIADHMFRFLSDHVLRAIGEGDLDASAASYVKLANGLRDPARAAIAMEIGGAPAVAWPGGDPEGASVSLGFLNGRIQAIAGGSDQIQRNLIGERLLGLPREPSFDRDLPFSEVRRRARSWGG